MADDAESRATAEDLAAAFALADSAGLAFCPNQP
jgi:hypothetical protein